LCTLARDGAIIRSIPGLHAKIYVIDSRVALVTSANATNGGMWRNWECGVVVSGEAEISELARLATRGFKSSHRPQTWTLSELEELQNPIAVLRKHYAPLVHRPSVEQDAHLAAIKLSRRAKKDLLAGFSGWLRLTLEAVVAQPQDSFDLDAVYSTCLPTIQSMFPGNRHPRPKVRQQLQRLRDLGLLEFLGGGTYRRTVET
jgi:phosphatidylserine/phosphatidylglycerophosphate/cardiolipin synthase-like enzyme